jgi:hypothetical protein
VKNPGSAVTTGVRSTLVKNPGSAVGSTLVVFCDSFLEVSTRKTLFTSVSYKLTSPYWGLAAAKDKKRCLIFLFPNIPFGFSVFEYEDPTICGKNSCIGLNVKEASILWGNSLTSVLLSLVALYLKLLLDLVFTGIPISHVVSSGILYVREVITPGTSYK